MQPEPATQGLRERDSGFAMLDGAAAAAGGRGRLVVIEGPAGIGKSGLLTGLRERSAGDCGSWRRERASSSGSFQLFEAPVAESRAAALAGAAGPAAAVFEAAAGSEGEGGASFAALHGLYWLCLNLAAERALLLAVDAARGGAMHWRDAAARELRRLGSRVSVENRRAVGGDGPRSLTARELDVARLVAEGRPNKQVAAAPFLSEKTVEHHLCGSTRSTACVRARSSRPRRAREGVAA